MDGDTTPEYQPPDIPDMDIKPDMMKCPGAVKTDPGAEQQQQQQQYRGYRQGEGGETAGYPASHLPTSTSSQAWAHSHSQYSNPVHHHQMSLGVAASSIPYHSSGYCSSQRDITTDEFREGEDEASLDMKAGREEIGHYEDNMISQTGPIRGYPGRADGFVWRPY